MSRDHCDCDTIDGVVYCPFYDVGFIECLEVPECPGGYDYDDDEYF